MKGGGRRRNNVWVRRGENFPLGHGGAAASEALQFCIKLVDGNGKGVTLLASAVIQSFSPCIIVFVLCTC